MNGHRNRSPYVHPSLGIALASLSGLVQAADAKTAEKMELDSLLVEDNQEVSGYRTERLSSGKFTEKLRDTPQSITVIPKKIIEQQNAETLEDILRNVPGVTFNSGEGGGGVGDSINIRGFSAENNIYRDGVRDPAKYSRSEMFNTEQVEVFKGGSASSWGVGAIGGAVNMVTKTPEARDFNRVTGGAGNADYRRFTADINHQLEGLGGAAYRVNLVAHHSGTAQRDWIERSRYGFAPSLSLGMDGPTRLTLAYEWLKDQGNYDFGIPAINNSNGNNRPGRIGSWSGYWGWRNMDKEDNESSRLYAKFTHEFNDKVSFDSQVSYFNLHHEYYVTTPGGDASVSAPGVKAANGVYRRNVNTPGRNQVNKTYSFQNNLTTKFSTWGLDHTLVTGAEWSKQTLDTQVKRLTAADTAQMNTLTSASNSWSRYPYSHETFVSQQISAQQFDTAFYFLDTIKFNEHWQALLSARHDNFRSSVNRNRSRSSTTSAWVDAGTSGRTDVLNSTQAALTYKPVNIGSIYLSYSNSRQPSSLIAISQRGQDTDGGTQKGETWELGTKWDLFNERLSLTAALFKTQRTMTYTDDDTGTTSSVGGKQRVRGLELSASGDITEDLSVFASYTYQATKTLKAAPDSESGLGIANTPRNTVSLWTTYQLPYDLSLSYGFRYVDQRDIFSGLGNGADSSTTRAGRIIVPSYSVHDLALSYQPYAGVNMRLNAGNLFNKHYWSQYNMRGYGVPGEGRNVQLTTEYSF